MQPLIISLFTQVCRAERELFESAFPLESTDIVSSLWALMEPMGAALHDAIRPRYTALNDVYTLAELVDLLSEEVKFRRVFLFSQHEYFLLNY